MPHALSDWLEGLEAAGLPIGVDADAFRREVVNGDEHGGLALAGDRGGQIGAPHLIDGIGDDRAVVAAGSACRTDTRRCEQGILAHQPQHAPLRGAHAAHAQPRPDFAMAFSVEGAFGQDATNGVKQAVIRHRPPWSWTQARDLWCRSAATVDRRSRHGPGPADGGNAVGPHGNRGDHAAHRLSLRRTKGRPAIQDGDLLVQQVALDHHSASPQ